MSYIMGGGGGGGGGGEDAVSAIVSVKVYSIIITTTRLTQTSLRHKQLLL